MFKWVKKMIVSHVKKYLTEEELNKLIDSANEKIDIPDMTEEEELKHFNNLKVFARDLILNLLDNWAKK